MRPASRATFAILASILAVAAPALAQSDRELATRQELILRAQDARKEGNHESALGQAKKAAAIKTTPSLRLFIAEEEQSLGAFADAYGSAKLCVLEAERDMTLRNREEIVASCRAIEQETVKRIGRVVIRPREPMPPGLRVIVGGSEMNTALFNTPYIVAVGKLTIEASAPHFLPSKVEIEIGPGNPVDHEVQLVQEPEVCQPGTTRDAAGHCVVACAAGMLATMDGLHCCWPGQTWSDEQRACAGPPTCPVGLVAQGATCASAGATQASKPVAPPPAKSRVPLYVAGAGVLVAGAGLVAWLVADSKYTTLKSACDQPGGCSTRTFDDSSGTIETLDVLSIAGLVLGGAAVVGGVGWYFLGESEHASEEPRGDTPRVGLGFDPVTRSARLYGRF